MKKVSLILSAVVITALVLSSYGGEVTNEVTIGKQVWMTTNLNVDKFRNGDLIPQAKTAEEWKKAGESKQPAWCYYDNDPANGTKYGRLYNWYAVNDARGLAPKGWHVASNAEFTVLVDFLGGKDITYTKIKSISSWKENCNGTNESGFSAHPGGGRRDDGTFGAIGDIGNWWTSTEDANIRNYGDGYLSEAWYHGLDCSGGENLSGEKEAGLSVRCLRD